MKKINIIILLAISIWAQDTVEDLTNLPVSGKVSPSVIDMPLIKDDIVSSEDDSLNSTQAKSLKIDSNQSTLEVMNGMVQKKVKKSESATVIKFNKKVPKVKDLEPAGVTSL